VPAWPVDRNIETAEPLNGGFDQRADVGVAADVGVNELGLCAE
jgi:hypothetical protein